VATTYKEEAPEVLMPDMEMPPEPRKVKAGYIWGALRILIGWIFLWSFLDKAFGLGFSTGRNAETGAIAFFGPDAWLNGGSPTAGFLEFGVKGPFAEFFRGLAGQVWVDWAYMLSLALIGLGLMLGIGTRIAAIGGIIWMAMFYLASAIWPEHNPVVDDHVVYSAALIGIAIVGAGRWLGFGSWWESTALVRRFPILK
jgi:thiosulfate dehydrogenase [quinone] large subunit